MNDHNLHRLIDDIEQLGENLTEWEVGFVDSISRRIGEDKPLTDKQRAQLLKIHAERVKG